MTIRLHCRDEHRRALVRAEKGLHGFDYIEVVDPDQKTLLVYFLGRAPEVIDKEHLRIEGGRRITDIQITEVEVDRDPETRDDIMTIRVDRAGDGSTYVLRAVERTRDGIEIPRQDFDARYDRVEFSFQAGCRTDLDCKPREECPPTPLQPPEINYLAKDYATFRRLILDRLSLVMPDWQERHAPDLGIAIVEIMAYVADYLSYYQDAVATEAYLDTARRRISVRRHAKLVDYQLHEGCNARAWVWVWCEGQWLDLPVSALFFATREKGDLLEDRVLGAEDAEKAQAGTFAIFEPRIPSGEARVDLREAHNLIRFYTWGDRECCLPVGATRATLRDGWVLPEPQPIEHQAPPPPEKPQPPSPGARGAERQRHEEPKPMRLLHLKVGDYLVLQEAKSPTTGREADADPKRRWVIRLTAVREIEDRVVMWPDEQGALHLPLLEVEWDIEDRLPFALCLSSVGSAPECEYLEDVSVAHGNVFLVDHGLRVDEPLGEVPEVVSEPCCEAAAQPTPVTRNAGRYEPRLTRRPVSFSSAVDPSAPASRMLDESPRGAGPIVSLTSMTARSNGKTGPSFDWKPVGDLLGCDSQDRAFVVEVDDRGFANLRFGDGVVGARPEAGATFSARYRVGNGRAGNVGAGAIVRVGFYDRTVTGVVLRAFNPLPSIGGREPEPIAEAKLLAPRAFQSQLERAIIIDDYATIAARDPQRPERTNTRLQSAAAALRWTGSWHEAFVALDPLGGETNDLELTAGVERYLEDYRRIGHDLRVAYASRVPLFLELSICVNPDFVPGHVKGALLDAFSDEVLPDGRLGFFHPDRLTFGDDVYVSDILATAQGVEGVESASLVSLTRQFEGDAGEVLAGVLELGPMEIARLDNDPDFPENGVLKLHMRGGR
ncbi:MAG TPA: putative baseplate assembly protein [Candidatus Eisenbacteria bacterium]|nr:putative baseplate assembly protein [Candidatus Eisenbacteria bacterium]